MELTRKQVIDLLEKADSTVYKEPKTKTAQALEYAIASLKTDEAYQLMYEGVEVYDKDTVLWMFRELQLEIEKHTMTSGVTNQGTWNECIACCSRVIQQKINTLTEGTDAREIKETT